MAALKIVVLIAISACVFGISSSKTIVNTGGFTTCHTEDYIKCALVIAGCTSTCTNDQVTQKTKTINKYNFKTTLTR